MHGLKRSVVIAIVMAPRLWAQDRVADTVHNLSTSGPGRVRAASESEICVFCHAPHNTQGARPLWNRDVSRASFQIYQSSTLNARPGQPTGASKLCLSCHDGTLALGNVLSRSEQIRMLGGDFLPAGLTNLGTDLSDDHPISFFYTGGLAASDRQLVNPAALPSEVRLDASDQMQCTSCHDPHHNAYGKFLVLKQEFGTLCTSCHDMTGWDVGSHRTSGAVVSTSGGADLPFATVAENACRGCHRSHTAGGHERLLLFENEEENCLDCHDGRTARTNLLAEIGKTSAHDPRRYTGRHDPAEVRGGSDVHVECTDCHNPHAATSEVPTTGYVGIGATLAHVRGVTIGGTDVETAQYEYEVCFRCHADAAVPVSRRITRQVQTANLRLEFATTNPSYHPVASPSGSMDTVSLVPSLPRGSLIRCTDCHNNDAGRRAGGTGPDGPHGSNYDYLLERNYTVTDDAAESEGAYSLCYKCHLRSSILGDESFPEHRRHIVEEHTPCSACHDPHGVPTAIGSGTDRTHLINFDTTLVRPDPRSGRLEFRDHGRFAGSCTLACHGERHVDQDYGR